MLTTIVQLDPIYIYWSPSERERLDVLRLRKEGAVRARATRSRCTRCWPTAASTPTPGKIDFVDNAVDPNAGTLRVRAVFPNPDKQLLPGQYANLRVLVGRDVPALLVPARAVIEEQGGSSVFVVTPDDVVQPRAVRRRRHATGRMRVIEKGLAVGREDRRRQPGQAARRA